MPAHKHSELMMQYAKDAMETDNPWERWEFRRKSNDPTKWEAFKTENNPSWLDDVEYRRKPQTININGFEVPEPVRSSLAINQKYYSATDFMMVNGFKASPYHWENDELDVHFLKAGLIHLTKEAAEQHAKALLSFTEMK